MVALIDRYQQRVTVDVENMIHACQQVQRGLASVSLRVIELSFVFVFFGRLQFDDI